jgi:hypothetical protein
VAYYTNIRTVGNGDNGETYGSNSEGHISYNIQPVSTDSERGSHERSYPQVCSLNQSIESF